MAPEATRIIKSVVRSIGEDIVLYQKLALILQQQRALYLSFDSARLNDNIAQQTPLLEKLHHNSLIRSQGMKSLGLTCDQNGISKVFKVLPFPLSEKVKKQWQSLEDLIEKCQRLNHDNGTSSATFHELVSQLNEPNQHVYSDHY